MANFKDRLRELITEKTKLKKMLRKKLLNIQISNFHHKLYHIM